MSMLRALPISTELGMNSKYTGQCLCGEIHYSVDVEPLFSGNCHCKDCQRASGSAFTPAMLFPEKNVVVSGEAKYFESTADSGNKHKRGFCPNCGSQLFAKFSNLPGMLGIKAGTLNDASHYAPKLDFHVASAATWDFMNPQLPKQQGAAQG
ncbi:GFA family protein [Crenobacter sp. SG2303]|uniref:GFA family protein n=1 Tax=Crenobacter oryzisoli TaxID=3056844 RepID=A0ABT7XTE2_9NEIS|nr:MULTISPECIES: GFA family protein [unclassified Crenobacter]MDN0077072.1 GFA family protein [Crenobacter sp. SG2303]MDN0084684.1 GFA family protein [Crenobacter sp. SG2305]